ncbi:hypothetical protein [Streptomyces sp. NBC_00340]|uniref:hypothetical protein n=1 Tax=Streptomyces sp. NBC_00340 TaxID=2975716 RepID=UPI00225A6B2B|nr:hypothetical protein [Streptomyces sp. NBC_00340]
MGVVAASAVALVAIPGAAVQGATAAGGPDAGPALASGRTTECVGTRPARSLPGPGPAVYRVLDYAEKRGATRFRNVFTGSSVDEGRRTAHVYRIPSRAFDADVCSHAEKGVRVRLHATDVSGVRLAALVERVGDDMGRWDGRFELREVAPDPRGFVFFGVDDPAAAEPVLRKAFGPFWARHITVRYAEESSALRLASDLFERGV